jgi:LacI family transcriptional regulator
MVDRPTISDLAKAAGVSVATVDRVLNRRLPVRGDTAERVVAAAEAIGYHATSLLKRRLLEIPNRRFGFLLQKRQDTFYQDFAQALVKATASAPNINGKAMVDFSEELVPATIALRLREMAQRCDAIAIVAVDHPIVNDAVEEISAKGIPVFSLLSDIMAPSRRACFGADTRKAGRTAGWAMSRLIHTPGPVGVLVGSHRYLSQELAEISFRSFMREHAPHLPLLESVIVLDDDRIAYEAVVDMIASNPGLAGIYASGGGRDGFIRALHDEGAGRNIVTVCNELTATTRAALIAGDVDVVLQTPIHVISAALIHHMADACEAAPRVAGGAFVFPVEIHVSETI